MFRDTFRGDDATVVKLPVRIPGHGANNLFSLAVSLILLVVIAVQFRHVSLGQLSGIIPVSPLFWICFSGYYLAQPVSEWIIYRQLWRLPWSGFAALLRKLVSNELVLGYLGDAQFYSWARARLKMAAAPFGAIKDVAILSALAGNIATVIMLAITWPFLNGEIGMELRPIFFSLGVVLVTSFVIIFLRGKLFSLPRPYLRTIIAAHAGRIAAMLGLLAMMWHVALPDVPMSLWLLLAALRMLISRLPLVPNKEVVFSGMAVFLLGQEAPVAELLAMIAGAVLATHLCVGALLALADLVETGKSQMGGR